jgi:hypothetical protein
LDRAREGEAAAKEYFAVLDDAAAGFPSPRSTDQFEPESQPTRGGASGAEKGANRQRIWTQSSTPRIMFIVHAASPAAIV